ncbi:MAG: asparagine synthase (glutamine-hydrolyzing) [Chitinophagaceae bacterium]
MGYGIYKFDIYSMCGIAGILNFRNNNSEDDYSLLKQRLQLMNNALQHRGPDGEGSWINEDRSVALGHRRLSIIDLSNAGHQPMQYATKDEKSKHNYTIIHNGEIYNYIELKEELVKHGYTFQSQTDTEVIAAAYDYWKDLCVDHFDGMFAFAIWDEKNKELFAARDRFGEKPFFYYFDEKQFLFASEMKALWSAGVDRIPNQKMLFNFITIGYTDNPNQPGETFFENIHKLPPATCLKYSLQKNELSLEKYWDIDPEKQDKHITTTDALEKFSHLLTTSVQRRLRSDVAIGTSLSGGLDSSSIIAIASSFTNAPVTAFTAVFPQFEKDESAYAKQVAEQFKLQHFTTTISGDDLVSDWQKLCHHQEAPFGSASVYAQYKVYELANQQGIKVLLDGQGADETLAGYHKYYKWYWQELFRNRKLRNSNEIKAAKELGVKEKFDFKNVIASYFPDFATIVLENRYLLNAIKHEDLTREFVQQQSKEAYYALPERFTLNNALHFNTCTHGLEQLLKYADRNAMAHGREVRLPFLSHELVEFIFSLPAHFKIRNGWTKWILRKTMEKSLPAETTWRQDKVGFEPPQKNWMENKKLQEYIFAAKQTLVSKNVLRPETLERKVSPHNANAAKGFDWRYLSAASLFYS